jgi:hypothetical protein
MFWDGRVKPFHTDRYEAGHRATDYKKWLNAVKPYKIKCACRALPAGLDLLMLYRAVL